jgi:hypothetical protein
MTAAWAPRFCRLAGWSDAEQDDVPLRAHLDEVLIGGWEKRPIVVVDYDPAWPARFIMERGRINRALDQLPHSVEHIGSTAVPGLAAKPIIDSSHG